MCIGMREVESYTRMYNSLTKCQNVLSFSLFELYVGT